MRTRSDLMETDGFNSLPAGGRGLKKKFQKLFGVNRAQPGPNAITATDGNLSPSDKEPQNVDRLDADRRALKDLVVQILKQSLSTEVNVVALTYAVTAICQEDEQDKQWKQRDGTPPPWRPSGWKKLHDSTLCSLVEECMDNTSSSPPADLVEKSSLQVDICSMGRQLKQDLLWVVEVVKSSYPPELHICNSYARWYHQTFSARLKKIAEFGLDDKDCTSLLLWVNEYYPEILRKPELASEIDHEALGKLLPKKLLKPLEEQYLSKQQSEMATCIDRVLEEAKQKWEDGEEPSRKEGCFVSPVAYDLIPDLMGQLHQEVTAEYVKRLLRGEVKLKNKERQEKAYMTVKNNAESLHSLFVKMGSKEDWLKEILNKIAEVLKLQDLPAIQMQVVLLGTDYPDLR
eukprot:superscaffoldBa00002427_g14202